MVMLKRIHCFYIPRPALIPFRDCESDHQKFHSPICPRSPTPSCSFLLLLRHLIFKRLHPTIGSACPNARSQTTRGLQSWRIVIVWRCGLVDGYRGGRGFGPPLLGCRCWLMDVWGGEPPSVADGVGVFC